MIKAGIIINQKKFEFSIGRDIDMEIIDIWYEFEEWAEEIDMNDCNSDVVFQLSDGSKWCATFFTYQNLLTLSNKNQNTKECLSGQYFYADKPIFISKMEKSVILSVINDIITNELENNKELIPCVFTRVEND